MTRLVLIAFLALPISTDTFGQLSFERTRGPYGGAMAMVADSNGTVYAATFSSDYGPPGYLYRLDPTTMLWTETLGYSNTIVKQMALGLNGDIYLANTYVEALSAGGVSRISTDGPSWNGGVSFEKTYPCSIAIADNGGIIVGAGDGVYRSDDEGENYESLGPEQIKFCALAPVGRAIYAGSEDGLYLSPNGDDKWRFLGLSGYQVYSLLVSEDGPIYIGTNQGLLVDRNRTHEFEGPFFDGYVFRSMFETSNGEILLGLDPISRDVDGGIFRLDPDGMTLSSIAATGRYVFEFLEVPSLGVFASTSSSVFLRRHGSTGWKEVGLPNTTLRELQSAPNGLLFANHNVNGTSAGISYSSDKGETWTRVGNGRQMLVTRRNELFTLYRASINYYGTSYEGIQETHTLPDGYHLEVVANGRGEIFISTRYADREDERGIYRSRDRGKSWEFVGLEGIQINMLVIDQEDRLWAVDKRAIYRSDPNGENWTTIRNQITGSRQSISGIFVSSGRWVFVSAGSVYRGGYNGEFFEVIRPYWFDGITESPDGRLYMATPYDGILISDDQGFTWTEEPANLEDIFRGRYEIEHLVMDRDGTLFIGTRGFGVYRSTSQPTTTETFGRDDGVAPEKRLLLKLYPNPARESTRISYHNPEAGRVKLLLYDILGKRIRVLEEGYRPAGEHEVQIEAGDLSTGVYFLRMTAGEFSQTRKVLVMR
ncbi:MAG: hypothetical protein BMS9Abin05_2757 [Rhodothermia bacterium]|nr:MAG: hypothetical protein BMS9Abin05_2757 [Rhodothermia bacterium]